MGVVLGDLWPERRPVSTKILDRSPVAWHYAVRLVVALVLSYPVWLIQNLGTGWVVGVVGVLLFLLIIRFDGIVCRWLTARTQQK